jgi:hypothetical protein
MTDGFQKSSDLPYICAEVHGPQLPGALVCDTFAKDEKIPGERVVVAMLDVRRSVCDNAILPVSRMIEMKRGIHLPSRQISGLPQGKSRSALRSVTNIATTRVPHMGRIPSSQLRVASDAEPTAVHATGCVIYPQWLGRTKRTRFFGSCKARRDRSGAASIATHKRVESTPCLEGNGPLPSCRVLVAITFSSNFPVLLIAVLVRQLVEA